MGGLLTAKDGATIITADDLMMHHQARPQPTVRVPLERIVSVELEEKGNTLLLSTIRIVTQNGTVLDLEVSTEEGGDDRFLNEMETAIWQKKHRLCVP